jgi:hypothetical protein
MNPFKPRPSQKVLISFYAVSKKEDGKKSRLHTGQDAGPGRSFNLPFRRNLEMLDPMAVVFSWRKPQALSYP